MSTDGSISSNPRKPPAQRLSPEKQVSQANGICMFFIQGRCKFGDTCKRSHGRAQGIGDQDVFATGASAAPPDPRIRVTALGPRAIAATVSSRSSRSHPSSSSSFNGQPAPSVNGSPVRRLPARRPCLFWKQFGECPTNNCKYEHNPQVLEDVPRGVEGITIPDAVRGLREARFKVAHQAGNYRKEEARLAEEVTQGTALRQEATTAPTSDNGFFIRSSIDEPRRVFSRRPYQHDRQGWDAIIRYTTGEALAPAEATAARREAEEQRRLVRQQESLRILREAEARMAREEAEAAARRVEREAAARKEVARRVRIAQQEEARKVQEAARKAREAQEEVARQTRVAQLEEARRAREAQQEEARRAREARQEEARRAHEARMIEIAKEEAAVTVQHIVLDFTVVTFSAGLAIHDILTGFESCRIRIKNLPLDATRNEVYGLFTQQGIKPSQFHVIGMNRPPNGRQEAHVIGHEDLKMVAIALDGVDFRQEQLLFEVSQHGGGDGMRASAGDSDVLTLTWRAPAVGFVATYNDIAAAQEKIRDLDKKTCLGRRVKVEFNKQKNCAAMLPSSEVLIRGFSPTISDEEASQFAGSTVLRRLKPVDFDVTQAPELVRRHIDSIAGGQLSRFEDVTTDTLGGTYTVRAHFNTWTKAKEVLQRIEKQRFQFIGNNSFCWLRLPDPFQYTITISNQQYGAQKKMWDALLEGAKNNDGHKLSVTGRDKVHIIRLGGEDKKAVGSLKVRVENVAAGEKLDSWHMSVGQKFLDSVFDETRAFLRNDRRLRTFKVYGEPRAVDAARIMVRDEVTRLESLEQTVLLKRQSVRFFVMRGLAVLKEELGEDSVSLDVSSCPAKIIIKGGESARHVLNRLIQESLDISNIAVKTLGKATCPICYDDVASPIQLGCGHTYCTSCIRHFLTSATSFPLSCMGDEDKCHAPIPIPTIQRFLLPPQFTSLLETAFVTHIEHLPQEFKYCTTADCGQIYRCGNSETASIIHCPSCLSAVCASCHQEAHEGMTCADRKLYNDPAEQERLNDELARASGFKKCPDCAVLIEKIDGCNHMSCKCGAHICWVCMGVFPNEGIYNHMNMAHGGIGVGD